MFDVKIQYLQMYASLKKKHEEAKDLLVKALINNNRMQMLNNPVTEDKISSALLHSGLNIPRSYISRSALKVQRD